MTTATLLIPELGEIVSAGDPKRRAEAARRISELFLQGAATARRVVDFWKTRPTF